MNRAWHREHALPGNATLAERIGWHREHQQRCACRPVPPGLLKELGRPGRGSRDPAIDAYLARVSPKSRALLLELRKAIRAIVPEAEECISYRIPAFRFGGRIIAGFSATSQGCSYYPFSGRTLRTLAEELKGYDQTKSALHLGPDRRLPSSLLRKLLRTRIAEGEPKSRPPARAKPRP